MEQVILNTSGNGLWSGHPRAVRITDMRLKKGLEFDDGNIYGELRVYFDTNTWNIDHHGLIYTDPKFLRELITFLKSHGLPGSDVDYSEQGMQGRKYVSLDAGKKFYRAWMEKFGIAKSKLVEQAGY